MARDFVSSVDITDFRLPYELGMQTCNGFGCFSEHHFRQFACRLITISILSLRIQLAI